MNKIFLHLINLTFISAFILPVSHNLNATVFDDSNQICPPPQNPFLDLLKRDISKILTLYKDYTLRRSQMMANYKQAAQFLQGHPHAEEYLEPLWEQILALEYPYINQAIVPRANLYAWGIPDENAIRTISKYAPIVELGAGKGYWAYMLSQYGVDIVAFDKHLATELWLPVQEGDERAVSHYQNRTLFLCWPPQTREYPLASRALANFSGQYVIYVGENEGGATADEDFFLMLERDFTLVESASIYNWPGFSDRLKVYERKTP